MRLPCFVIAALVFSVLASAPAPTLAATGPPTPTLAACMAPPASAASIASPSGRQTDFEPRTQTTFEVRPAGEGIELSGRSGALTFTKQVSRDGRMTLQLMVGSDRATFETTSDGLSVTLGRKKTKIDPRNASDRDYENLRIQLARSQSVRQFRRQLAALEAADDDRPAVLGTLTAGALVSVLDGDEGAPRRIAKRIAHRQQERLRAVSMSPGCFPEYEREVVTAWDDLELCYYSVSPLLWRVCDLRWFLWVESAWFSFISCSWGF